MRKPRKSTLDAWLDTFADAGDGTLDIPLRQEMAGDIAPAYE